MEFNFDNVLKEAQNVASKGNGEGGSDYKYKLVYPQTGTLSIKLLFNMKSNTVKRLVNRHTIDDNKVPCMKTWGQECPICKMIDQIASATGYDMYKVKSVSRGISVVEYVDSSYKLEKVNKGDTILLMYPWTVYKDLSTIIAQAQSGADLKRLMASNEGFVVNINRGNDNKYSAMINPFGVRKSKDNDADFDKLLGDLEDLNDLILPSSPTDEIRAQINEVAQALQAKYLGGTQSAPVYNQAPAEQSAMNLGGFGNQQQPVQGFGQPQGGFQQQPTPVVNQQPQTFNQQPQQQGFGQMQPQQQAQGGNPPCIGKHRVEDPNICLMCPVELQCMKASTQVS